MRLIDADALYERFFDLEAQALDYVGKLIERDSDNVSVVWWSAILTERTAFKHDVLDAPTVDAVEVIHCEHCRHHENDSSSDSHWCFVWETFTDNHVYCSFAERREDGNSK